MNIRKIILCVAALSLAIGLSAVLVPRASAENGVRFVCDGGTGDGRTAEYPMSDIKGAVRALSGTGGTLVVCGKLSFNEYIGFSSVSGTSNGDRPITVTCVYGGVDYRKEKSAELRMGASLGLAGRFVFENINIKTTGSEKEKSFICGGRQTVFGEGIVCTKSEKAPYPSIVGISVSEPQKGDGNVTVKSGTYTDVCTGNRGYDTIGNTYLQIDGGSFEGQVSSSGSAGTSHEGNASAVINGGIFAGNAGVLADVSESASATLNGGVFRYDFTMNGNYNELNINGCVFDKASSVTIKNRLPSEDDPTAVISKVNITAYGGEPAELLNCIKTKDVQINISENLVNGGVVPPVGGDADKQTDDANAQGTDKVLSPEPQVQKTSIGKGVSAHYKSVVAVLVCVIVLCTAVLTARLRGRNTQNYGC